MNNIETKISTDKTTDILEENGLDKQLTNGKIVEYDNEWLDVLGSGSLMKKIIKAGQNDTRPQRLQTCIIDYRLELIDGTLIEEENHFEFQLGDCEVIQGLDVAIGLMNLHEKARLKIESRLAFGTKGLPPKIPPDTTIVYEIELRSVEPEKEPETLPIAERKIQGNKKKDRGNWWYVRGENTIAIQCYRRALDFLDEVEGGITTPNSDNEVISDAALQELLEDRIRVYNNMAAAQIKLELYDAALNSLKNVLNCQPNNVKALFRKAKIFRAKNDLNSSLQTLKKAIEIDANNTDIQKEIYSCNQLLQKQEEREKEVARRMFNNTSNSKDKLKSKPKKDNLFKFATTLAVTFTVGLLSVIAYKTKYS